MILFNEQFWILSVIFYRKVVFFWFRIKLEMDDYFVFWLLKFLNLLQILNFDLIYIFELFILCKVLIWILDRRNIEIINRKIILVLFWGFQNLEEIYIYIYYGLSIELFNFWIFYQICIVVRGGRIYFLNNKWGLLGWIKINYRLFGVVIYRSVVFI